MNYGRNLKQDKKIVITVSFIKSLVGWGKRKGFQLNVFTVKKQENELVRVVILLVKKLSASTRKILVQKFEYTIHLKHLGFLTTRSFKRRYLKHTFAIISRI